jgi:DNA-binding MarR family transcriptional regulator
MVLRIVGLSPGISPGELADRLHVHPSTLTGRLREMVRRGLLRRVGDPDDRRRALLELAPAGRRINALKSGTTEAAVRRALARHPVAEVSATARLFDQLAASLRDE